MSLASWPVSARRVPVSDEVVATSSAHLIHGLDVVALRTLLSHLNASRKRPGLPQPYETATSTSCQTRRDVSPCAHMSGTAETVHLPLVFILTFLVSINVEA